PPRSTLFPTRRSSDLTETQKTTYHRHVAGLSMRIDHKNNFLPTQAHSIDSARGEIPAPFGKVIKPAVQKMLGSDVHDVALARLRSEEHTSELQSLAYL